MPRGNVGICDRWLGRLSCSRCVDDRALADCPGVSRFLSCDQLSGVLGSGSHGVVGFAMSVGRLVVAVDPSVGVAAAVFALAWEADAEAGVLGSAVVEPAGGRAFVPGLVELVAIPLAVNLASSALCALVARLISARKSDGGDVEVLEVTVSDGDRVVVVRTSRGPV